MIDVLDFESNNDSVQEIYSTRIEIDILNLILSMNL